MARFDSQQRARILEAAIGVFAARGLDGATIREVGRAAGVNSALMYYYFENKDTLFQEALRRVLEDFMGHLQSHRRSFTGAADRLGFLVNGIFDYYTAHPDRLRLMARALSQHPEPFGRLLSSALRELVLVPLEILQEGITSGELQPMHPVEAWWSILGLCLFGLHLQPVLQHLDPTAIPANLPDFSQRRQQILELLAHGLTRYGSPNGRSSHLRRRKTNRQRDR